MVFKSWSFGDHRYRWEKINSVSYSCKRERTQKLMLYILHIDNLYVGIINKESVCNLNKEITNLNKWQIVKSKSQISILSYSVLFNKYLIIAHFARHCANAGYTSKCSPSCELQVGDFYSPTYTHRYCSKFGLQNWLGRKESNYFISVLEKWAKMIINTFPQM